MAHANAGGRFANISAASGLDFPDDGRALASLDWDLDGDLDVWITNRNAPRLRLMRNDTQQPNHFVAFRLIGNGTTVNRDAIGARIEVVTQGESDTTHVKTLRAGDAFLAQSSKWMHFGLGPRGAIKSVRVRWPDGSTEEFGSVTSNRRYRLRQAAGHAELWEPPTRKLAISPGKPALPTGSAAARVPLLFPLRVPDISYEDFDGRDRDLPIGERPLLINLWASWCAPCLQELQGIKQRHQEFADAGLDVIALSVDGLSLGQNGEDKSTPSTTDEQLITEMDVPFDTGRATKPAVDTIQFLHDLIIHSRQTIPIPTTVLVDGEGRLVAIYKGVLPLDHVLADIKRSQATLVERKVNAAMVDGTAIDHDQLNRVAHRTHAHTLFQAGFAMRHADRIQDAISYFSDAVAIAPESATTHLYLGDTYKEAKRYNEATAEYQAALELSPELAGAHVNLASVLRETGQGATAVDHYEQAIRIKPDDFEAHVDFATLLNELGRVAEAVTQFQVATRIRPDDVDVHRELGQMLVRQKRYNDALPHFRSVSRLHPDSAAAHANLGNVLKIVGRHQEAAQQYEAALRIAPDSAETHNNLGVALQAQDRFDEAVARYRAALELNPQLAAAHRNWGRALQAQGAFEEATTHFQAAVRLKPDFAPAYYELGRTQLMLDRADLAVVNLEQAIRLSPSDASAHRDFGRALIVLGNLGGGIAQYRRSLRLKPNDLQTLNNLAWQLATCPDDQVRDGAEAVELAQRAARITNGKNPLVLDTLAAAYAEIGEFDQAARWQTRAIELSPSDQKDDGRAKLELYESGTPFRERRAEKAEPPRDD